MSDGSRRILSISEITGMENDTITMQDIFVYKRRGRAETGAVMGDFVPTGIRPHCFDQLVAAGVDVNADLFKRLEV